MLSELSMRRPEQCLSDLRLDRYLAGEYPAAEQAAVRAHVQGCPRCAELLAEREDEGAAYLSTTQSFALQNELRRRARARQRRHLLWGVASGLSVAAALLLVLLPRPDAELGTRTKGGPRLGFFVKHGERVRPGLDGEHVQPGDRLRFTYAIERPLFLTILSFDGAGQASEYFPQTRVVAGRNLPLPSSVELDGTLGPERLYAVFCEAETSVPELLLTLKNKSGNLTAPAGCSLDIVHLVKEARH